MAIFCTDFPLVRGTSQALQRGLFARNLRAGLLLVFCALGYGQSIPIPIDEGIVVEGESGACILRARVDGSANLMISGDRLTLRALHGENPSDQGTVCSAALPEAPLRAFRMTSVRGRGRVLLVENPSGRNGFQAWIRVDDEPSGDDLYEARISWKLEERGKGEGEKSTQLILRPRGSPAVWATEGGAEDARRLPGGRLSSFENDPLRYDSGRAGELEFRGRVDGVAEFYIRGDRLNADVKSGQLVKVERFRFTQPLPGVTLSSVSVEKKDGRGEVELTQQPNSTNDFTAIVRVSDPQGGSDRYHFVLSWAR